MRRKSTQDQAGIDLTCEEFRYGGRGPETSDHLEAGSIGDPLRSMAFRSIAEGTLAPVIRRPAQFHPARHR
jgi:hypothetical protein